MGEKLKPNFTPVPNVILDEIMRTLNEGELKTLLAICRYTYGWGKKSDRISLKQLSEITGIGDRSNVHRAIKRLGNLIVLTPGDPSKNLASEYQINFDISDDLLSQKQQDLLSDRQQPVVRPVVSSATFQRKPKKEEISPNGSSVLSHSKKRKQSAPDPAQLKAFARFYEAYPRHIGRAEAERAWLELNPDEGLVGWIMDGLQRYAEQVEDSEPRYIKHPATWLNARRWEDEPISVAGSRNGGAPPKIARADEESDSFILEDGTHINRGTYRRMYG